MRNTGNEQIEPADFEKLRKAYILADLIHKGQYRKQKSPSGELIPSVVHPIGVCAILMSNGVDIYSAASGLLHDCYEDAPDRIGDELVDFLLDEENAMEFIKNYQDDFQGRSSLAEIKNWIIQNYNNGFTPTEFLDFFIPKLLGEEIGETVKIIVHGCTDTYKRSDLDKSERKQLFSNYIIAHSPENIRIIGLRGADRLHNLLTLEVHDPENMERILWETLEAVYPMVNAVNPMLASFIEITSGELALKYDMDFFRFCFSKHSEIMSDDNGLFRYSNARMNRFLDCVKIIERYGRSHGERAHLLGFILEGSNALRHNWIEYKQQVLDSSDFADELLDSKVRRWWRSFPRRIISGDISTLLEELKNLFRESYENEGKGEIMGLAQYMLLERAWTRPTAELISDYFEPLKVLEFDQVYNSMSGVMKSANQNLWIKFADHYQCSESFIRTKSGEILTTFTINDSSFNLIHSIYKIKNAINPFLTIITNDEIRYLFHLNSYYKSQGVKPPYSERYPFFMVRYCYTQENHSIFQHPIGLTGLYALTDSSKNPTDFPEAIIVQYKRKVM